MNDPTADTARQVRQLFDAKAAAWPSKYGQNGRLTTRLTRLVAAVGHHVSAEGSVLDLGCGTGDLAVSLTAAGLKVSGCDISPEMLHRAAAADPTRKIDWVQLETAWHELPYAAEAFDAVVASSVLEYVSDPVAVLRECRRVLRVGGVLLCTVPDPQHPVRRIERLLRFADRAPAMTERWPKLADYLTYLRISRQRHPTGWWQAAAAQADLLNLPYLADSPERSTLRLLTFQRAEMRDGT